MTQRQWLERERQPQFSGINARQTLRNMVGTSGRRIHRTINRNALRASVRRLIRAMGD